MVFKTVSSSLFLKDDMETGLTSLLLALGIVTNWDRFDYFAALCLKKKSIYEKKGLESKLPKKYVLNLFSEPQHLAEIKTPKLLKISNKGVKNLRERKLKNI